MKVAWCTGALSWLDSLTPVKRNATAYKDILNSYVLPVCATYTFRHFHLGYSHILLQLLS